MQMLVLLKFKKRLKTRLFLSLAITYFEKIDSDESSTFGKLSNLSFGDNNSLPNYGNDRKFKIKKAHLV